MTTSVTSVVTAVTTGAEVGTGAGRTGEEKIVTVEAVMTTIEAKPATGTETDAVLSSKRYNCRDSR